jgi:vacuolar-type H+-ATPase subunit I/STV1
VNLGDRERLIRRIRQIRHANAERDQPTRDAGGPPPDRVEVLERRVAHLEELLEGLQDSVHREAERHAGLIAELQAQVEPGTMNAALAEDARQRGL